MLKDLGKPNEAIVSYETALKLAPDNAGFHNNLGTAQHEQHRLDDAMSSLRQAVALKPDLAEALYNLGEVLAERGELGEAVALLGRAAQQLGFATVDWFYARKRACDWAGYGEAEMQCCEQAGKQTFKLLAISSSPAEQLGCARRAASAPGSYVPRRLKVASAAVGASQSCTLATTSPSLRAASAVLAYTSESETPRYRATRKSQKLRMRLGGGPNLLDPFPEKPLGMHRRTYGRLFNKAAAAQERSNALQRQYLQRRVPEEAVADTMPPPHAFRRQARSN